MKLKILSRVLDKSNIPCYNWPHSEMTSMIPRDMAATLTQHLQWFPVVQLSGPRQSGKTTLATMTFPDSPYANLENPSILAICRDDPHGFLSGMLQKGTPVLIDEAQQFPELFSWIQVFADEHSTNGLFVLTGSQNFLLNNRISQSLAGRASVLILLPLSVREQPPQSYLDDRLYKGAFPRLYDERRPPPPPHILYENYITTYLERDVRQLTAVEDLSLFHRFLRLCAARIGQVTNKANLSIECGISQPTVERWLSVLEASHVIFRLQPFHANINKRLVKSPKLYFCDTGLACRLIGIQSPQMLEIHPLRDALFENLVFTELAKQALSPGVPPDIHFLRDKTGHEVDFLLVKDGRFRAFEAKSGATFRSDYLRDIRYFRNLLGSRITDAYLLYAGDDESRVDGVHVLNAIRYFAGEK